MLVPVLVTVFFNSFMKVSFGTDTESSYHFNGEIKGLVLTVEITAVAYFPPETATDTFCCILYI